MIKTRGVASAIAAAVVTSTCTFSTFVCGQSPSPISAGPVVYVDATEVPPEGCLSCAQPAFTQYVRPHAHFNYSDYVNPYPAGFCCRTVVGELLCDIGCHLRRVVYCQDDILATSCDGCEGGCANPLDCVPRLRDLFPRPWLCRACGTGWTSGEVCAADGCGAGCQSCIEGGEIIGETMGSSEGLSPPVAEPDSEGSGPNIPDAPAPPVQSARLRAILAPPGLTAPDPYVKRSQYAQPIRSQHIRSASRRITIAKGQAKAGRSAAPASQTQPSAAPPALARPSSDDRGKASVAKPSETSAQPTSAPPARTVRFADQFGKSARAPLTRAAFR